MTRTVCEKVGDWEPYEHPDDEECEGCSSTKCPIKILIDTAKALQRRIERLEYAHEVPY